MNKKVLSVGALAVCGIFGGAHAENLYWAGGTAEGVYSDSANWRTGNANGAAAGRAPVAGSDVAWFDGIQGTVNFTHTTDTMLPKISVRRWGGTDSDVQFNFPAGVTTSTVAEDWAFGFPWDNSGLSKITIGSGTFDLGNKKLSQNNNGAPRLTVSGNGTVVKNVLEWAPKQGENAGGRVEFEVKDGARVETFKYLLPAVTKESEPRSAVTLSGAGTTVKDLQLRKPATGISFTDVTATDGAKIYDSEWHLAGGTALTISGAETYASNLFVKTLRHEASVEIKGGTLEDCSVSLAGDAQNEPYSNSVLKVENVTLKRFSFLPRAWSHDCKTTFGPGVTFEDLKEFSFVGANNDFRLTGEGVTVDYDGREFLLWGGGNGMQEDTDGHIIEIDGGAKINCSKLKWEFCNRNMYRSTLRMRGEGSGIWVRPLNDDQIGWVYQPVKIGWGNNQKNVAQHNRVEVTDGATFAILKREGVDYSDKAYQDGIGFFGAGVNGNTNTMLVANGGTFTNEFSFIFGNRHYEGGSDNAVIVSNGTFHCEGEVVLGVKVSNVRNRIEVADGGTFRAKNIQMCNSKKAYGGKVTCRGGTIYTGTLNTHMDDPELEPLTITMGGETGGIVAERLDNWDGIPVNLAFEIGEKGKTDGSAYLTLTHPDTNGRAAALCHKYDVEQGTCGFKLKLDISTRWAYQSKSGPRLKLISVTNNHWNKTGLEVIAKTAVEEELLGCKLEVADGENGMVDLLLAPAGTRGFKIVIR